MLMKNKQTKIKYQLCVHIILFGQLTRKLNQGGKKAEQ